MGELLYFGVLFGVLQFEAQLATLGTVESATGDGDASYHVLGGYLVDEFGAGLCHVGCTLEW